MPAPAPRTHSTADVDVTSPTATSTTGAAAATDAATARSAMPIRRRMWSVAELRGNRRLQVGQNFALELLDALTEGAAEVSLTILAARERMEVLDHPFEAVTLDEVIRHEERQLVRGQRALLAVAHREPPRGARRPGVGASATEGRGLRTPARRHRAP